jgi:hypothetical protein
MRGRGTRIIQADVKHYSPAEVDDFVRANAERLQPRKEEVPDIRHSPTMVMIKAGDPDKRPPLRLIVSNDEQEAALAAYREMIAEQEAIIESENARRRRERTDEERARVNAAKRKKDNHHRGRIKSETIVTEGRTHTVKKVQTTASKLVNSGKLSKDLYNQLTGFAQLVAQALGVAVHDGEDSTARQISQYADAGGGSFGSRTLKDSIIDARTELREIGQLIPPQLQEVFVQIVGEEVGSLMSKPMTLDQIGEMRGYHHKQASASGGTQVFDVVALVCHLARMRGTLSRENMRGMRQSVAGTAKHHSQQGLLAAE